MATVESRAPDRGDLTRRWWLSGLIAIGGLAAALVLAALKRAQLGDGQWSTTDLQVLWASADAVWHGDDPYQRYTPDGDMTFVYPPFGGLLLSPLSLLPLHTLRLIWFTGIVVAMQALLWRSTGWVGMRNRWLRIGISLVGPAALLFFDPVRQEFWSGQINVFLTLLIVADLSRPDGARGKGVLIGLATSIKLVPGLFIVYLLLTRRIKEAVVAAATFAATVLIGFLVLPGAAWDYWTKYFWNAERLYPHPGILYNQSLRGAIARLLHRDDVTWAWALTAVVVVAVGLAVCVALYRRGLDREGAMLCGITALLVSPVSWVYHWVWLIPVLVVLAAATWRTRSPIWAAVTLVTLVIPVIHPYTWVGDYSAQPSGVVQQLNTSSLVVLGLLLIAAAAALLWASPPRPPDAGLDTGRSLHDRRGATRPPAAAAAADSGVADSGVPESVT